MQRMGQTEQYNRDITSIESNFQNKSPIGSRMQVP